MNPEWLGSSLWAAKATKKQVMNLWRKWDASCALPKLLKSKLCTLKDLESIYELPKLLKSKLWSSESSEKQVKHCNSLKSRFMNCWRNWEAINELPKLLKSKLWATEGTERSSALPKLEKHGCCWSYWAARVPEKHVMNHWRSFPGKQVMNHWRNWEASYGKDGWVYVDSCHCWAGMLAFMEQRSCGVPSGAAPVTRRGPFYERPAAATVGAASAGHPTTGMSTYKTAL